MENKQRVLLDLFCGAGGAARGYQLAGFKVVGVDIKPQPHCVSDGFVLMDALKAMRVLLDGGYIKDNHGGRWYLKDFDAIHASPPCQEYSSTRHLRNYNAATKGYALNLREKLIGKTRELLVESGKSWVIENVAFAPLPDAIILCGSMFGLPIRRHRWFASSILLFVPSPCRHVPGFYNIIGGKVRGYGSFSNQTRTYVDCKGATRRREGYPGKAVGVNAFNIDWMTVNEMSESIPPIYTKYIGEQLKQYLDRAPKEQ